MTLSYRDIADILKAIDESQAEAIEIEVEGIRLSVTKRIGGNTPSSLDLTPTENPQKVTEQPTSKSKSPEPTAESSTVKSEPVEDGYQIVRSPMVGTFYRRPNPESDAFVSPGVTVSVGDPMCLIEVMKLYTTIEAPTNGTIVSIFAEDGQLVEFDQQLFLIQTE